MSAIRDGAILRLMLDRPEKRNAVDRIAEVVDAQGDTHKLVASSAQFDETASDLRRASMFAEHTDEILRELGIDDDELLDLKFDGAIA